MLILRTTFFLQLGLVSLGFLFFAWPQTAQGQDTVELTQTDFFGLPNWHGREAAVEGFKLGQTRLDVLQLAKTNHLKLVTENPRTVGETGGLCRQDEPGCSVYQEKGSWIGVNLLFNPAERISKIRVSIPADAVQEVKRVNVAKKFKGRTYELFNHYSDKVRNEIFGLVEAKKIPVKVGGQDSNLTNLEYDYSHLGVIVRVTIDTRDNPPEPFDLEVDFVARQ